MRTPAPLSTPRTTHTFSTHLLFTPSIHTCRCALFPLFEELQNVKDPLEEVMLMELTSAHTSVTPSVHTQPHPLLTPSLCSQVMESTRVLAVLRYYEPRLREIFDACDICVTNALTSLYGRRV